MITGRFKTRKELVEKAIYLYYNTDCTINHIADNAEVSHNVIDRIITKYGKGHAGEQAVTASHCR